MIKKRNGTARVILILCAAIGILAGCGKGTGDSENASGAENKSADSSSGTEENAGEETGQNNGVESVIVLRTSSGFSARPTELSSMTLRVFFTAAIPRRGNFWLSRMANWE